MVKQLVFAIILLATFGLLGYTANRIIGFFKLTRPAFPVRDFGRRLWVVLDVAIGQTKIFRRPVTGFFHALVFWGFCVIAFGSIEMVIDGLFGTVRILSVLGPFYNLISASGDIFGLLVAGSIIIFLFRRIFLHVKRFEGIEMKSISHMDANLALSMILVLMLSLLGMNAAYCAGVVKSGDVLAGIYPVSGHLTGLFEGSSVVRINLIYEICWWSHILLIFVFANVLPYSKHFHVFMSVPNVFLSRLEPLGKLPNMDNITREVRLMLDPDAVFPGDSLDTPVERFGIRDAEDVSWKNYLDSLACTECGRCTSVCPANMTGKRLSPRKIMMDVRARMKEKGPGLVAGGRGYTDNRSLLRDYISEEELWACTTCNACARECPININHPVLIVDMRRYMVMEEASAPGLIKGMFSNIENNGAPWQFSQEDRLLWTKDIELKVN
ncbi:MAG: (Fe-S)-binding protein [bacterium]